MSTSQLLQTNILLRPDQRQTLEEVYVDTGKSMSKQVRELIDGAYPPLRKKELGSNIEENDRTKDINQLLQANESASFGRIFSGGEKK